MNHSIITEYQDDLQFSPAAVISKNLQSKSPQKQSEDIYSQKLQIKVKQLKTNIRKNKPLIQQLKAQRKFLRKICEKQKQKIQGTRVELIKAQYQNQIEQLRQQRHKLQDVIAVIHEQSSNKARDFVEAKEQININFMELSKALQQVRNENKTYEEMLIVKTQLMDERKDRISILRKQISQKLSIQRKYKQVVTQIHSLQYQKNLSF